MDAGFGCAGQTPQRVCLFLLGRRQDKDGFGGEGLLDWPDGFGERMGEREELLAALEDYRRGRSSAPLLRKWHCGLPGGAGLAAGMAGGIGGGGQEAGEEVDGEMTFVISSEEVDRHGDVVAAAGWRLAEYRQNPVLLWAHDYTRPVIGRARAVWGEPGLLLARLEFAPTDFAREVAALYRRGYQQGVSVGFKPLRYEERRQEGTGALLGIRFLEQELLEVSAVPVPANRQALRREVRAGVASGMPHGVSPGLAEMLAEVRAGLRLRPEQDC